MANVAPENTRQQPDTRTPSGWHKFWYTELAAAEKRLRNWTKQGNAIVRRFVDEREGGRNDPFPATTHNGYRLNLFHTNVSTLCAMLYGSTPRIDVSREHNDPDDDVARVAAVLYQRILQADADGGGEDLPTVLKACLQDRLLPGLGVARVRYDCTTCKVTRMDPQSGTAMEVDAIASERAPIDYVHWQDFRWGWCRTWKEMPWMAFRAWLDRDEVKRRFGDKIARKLEYKNQLPSGSQRLEETTDTDQMNNIQKAEIWEIWHKRERRVFWYSEGADLILDSRDDPLQLDNFWPVPRPLTANLTSTLYLPTADFMLSSDLYNQIDELFTRVTIITRAVKVVGVYDRAGSDSVGRMLKEGLENDLIPVDNWAMFAEKGGLQGTIDWFPVQEVVNTLATLRQVLVETVDALYQITGMSDILRGANTDQYTSDGTQQLKAKFGSIRVQALQDEFARFASDLEALRAEVMAKHFSPQTLAQQGSAQFLPEADKPLVMPALQLMQSPEIKWRIDIRPESIAMVDYAQLKAERTEFLNAMATYIQSAQAAVQAVPGALPILLEMLKWGMAGFKGSNYLEGTMDRAIDMAKQMPMPDPNQQQQQQNQAEMEKIQASLQAELQKIQAKSQADVQSIMAKSQSELQREALDHRNAMEQMLTDHRNDMAKLRADFQGDMQIIAAKLGADLENERAQSTYAAAEEQLEHRNTMVEKAADHQNALRERREEQLNLPLKGDD